MYRSPELKAKMRAIAEEIFGATEDPTQMPIGPEVSAKLEQISPDYLTFKTDENEDPIAWVVMIPTTKIIAQSFLSGEINERQLYEKTEPGQNYEALYICAAITAPKYRRQGWATRLTLEALDKLGGSDKILFSWPTSPEGKATLDKLEKTLGRPILRRQE